MTQEEAKKSRSTAMVALGLVMFVWLGLVQAASDDGAPIAAIVVLGVLGAGLFVGGLVIRP